MPELKVTTQHLQSDSTFSFASPHRVKCWKTPRARNVSMLCVIAPSRWAGRWSVSMFLTATSASLAHAQPAGTGFRSLSVRLPSAKQAW